MSIDCKAEPGVMLAKSPQHLPQRKDAQGIHLHRDRYRDYSLACGLRHLIYHGIQVAIAATRNSNQEYFMTAKKPGLYANIHAKQERIASGSGEHMNKSGSKDAPTVKDFKKAAKTEKKAPAKVSK